MGFAHSTAQSSPDHTAPTVKAASESPAISPPPTSDIVLMSDRQLAVRSLGRRGALGLDHVV